MGIGAIRIAKSVRIQEIGSIALSIFSFSQRWGFCGSQINPIGIQMKMYAKRVEIHHPVTIAPNIRMTS